MKLLKRWLNNKRVLKEYGPRFDLLSEELAGAFGHSVRLQHGMSKGGHDIILHAYKETQQIAVIRLVPRLDKVESEIAKKNEGAVYPHRIRYPLRPADRLNYEWRAYEALGPLGLSPKPLWRCDDAIACEWLPGERLAMRLKRNRNETVPYLLSAISLVRAMHDRQLFHLDLNLGNLILMDGRAKLGVIDFEYGILPSITVEQAQAFDYLKIIDHALRRRRGGRLLRKNFDLVANHLATEVPESVTHADLTLVKLELRRLEACQEAKDALHRIFANL